MRVQRVSSEVLHQISYLRAGTNGETEITQLPILRGFIEGLPASLQAIVCTGDLQGVVISSDIRSEPQLLGKALAQELAVLLEMHDIDSARTGVVLSGDFYSAPQADQRGASGDVREVWNAFLQHFRWVIGVAGNHDGFGSTSQALEKFVGQPNLHLLDGICTIDGLVVGGIGGIIGNSKRALRRSSEDYLSDLKQLRQVKPDLIVLHPSPAIPYLNLIGSEELGVAFEQQVFPLTVCGHVSWKQPCAELHNGNQLLNVDSRVVVLQSAIAR